MHARWAPALAFLLGCTTVVPAGATVGEPFDPAAHPDFTFVDGILDRIPVKNQASGKAWVDRINQTWGTSWTYFSAPRQSSFKCLSYAASTCSDWWQLKLGLVDRFAPYRSLTHGGTERGVNPRELECQYYHRAEALQDPAFFLMPPPVVDSLTHERLPYNMEAYCRLVAAPLPPRTYPDHALGPRFASYEGKPDYGMDGRYEVLWRFSLAGNATAMAAKLRHALDAHGPCYAGLDFSVPFGLPVHVVTIVGYGKVAGALRFVYRESFGDGRVGPKTGEPLYRSCPADRFSEVYCFPHELRYGFKRHGEGHLLEVRDSAGNLVDLDTLTVTVSGQAPSFSYRKVGTGRYLFPRPEVRAEAMWEATLSFSKRYFGPAATADGVDGGDRYVVELKFLGAMLREDARRRKFRTLEAQLGER